MDTTSLADTARAQIDRARAAVHGRSAHTVHGGHDRVLRQTVIALRAGETLHEHHNPRDATLQVLAGRVRLIAGTQVLEPVAGELLAVPAEDHTLGAVEGSAVLLTVRLVLAPPTLWRPMRAQPTSGTTRSRRATADCSGA
jgi:quercetin dioxygenase-like cupin family protein